MDKPQEILDPNIQPVTPKMMIVQGVIQNLPEILGAVKEIHRLNKKGKAFEQVLQSQFDELNINKENFALLVTSLTELSKSEIADDETKQMYREMIKILFNSFSNNMRSSQDVSSFLSDF